MMLQGIDTEVIAETLGYSHASVCNYVNWWSQRGIGATEDHRVALKSSITEEMLKGHRRAIRSRSPRDHGYSKNRWDTRVLQHYLIDTYGNKYSPERIRQILHRLGHSFKRRIKRPIKANEEAQQALRRKSIADEYEAKYASRLHFISLPRILQT